MEKHDNSIRVLVRVRPLLDRERKDAHSSVVSMPANDSSKTILHIPEDSPLKTKIRMETNDNSKVYTFDESVWSFNAEDENYINNRKLYNKTGSSLISHLFSGFNVCLLAYGQTSSGKTFTMMGNKEDPGLIPLIVRDVLRQREFLVSEKINCEVKVSYSEIYNEVVQDLLSSDRQKKLRVREHPSTGPYVENLTEVSLNDYSDFQHILQEGNSRRSTASTSMNDQSSRSHAILTLTLKQTKFQNSDDAGADTSIGDAEEEMISSIKLVDLAGSERLSKTKLYGQQDRMKEGSLINKSLTVLGRCINLLSSNSSGNSKQIVPYRDSTLTYILKENLGGNSKSFMVFCVSPVDFEETYQTLNYANQVKKIKTAARANKTKISEVQIDWKELLKTDQDVIDSLKDEVKELTEQLNSLKEGEPQVPTKFSNLITYLEKETSKLKFENKYLKAQVQLQAVQMTELQNYVDYMDHEFNNLYIELEDSKLKSAKAALKDNCNSKLAQFEMELQELDPRRVF